VSIETYARSRETAFLPSPEATLYQRRPGASETLQPRVD